MWSELLGPPGLILLAAFIGGFGAFWSAVKQANLRAKSEGTAAAQTALLQDIAARSGNRKELEDIIRARSRIMNTDRRRADDIAESIIRRLPERAEDLIALEQSKHDQADQFANEFRMNWEPLIRSTIDSFDKLVKQLQGKGVKLEVLENNEFPLTVFWGPLREYEIRSIKAPGVGTEFAGRMYFSAINVTPEEAKNSEAYLRIGGMDGREVTLRMSLSEARFVRVSPQKAEPEVQKISAAKDGAPPKEFRDFIDEGLSQVLEGIVLMQKVHGGTSDAPDNWRYKRSP